ncbi:hypothetical protein [Streptomyces sp. NPDC056192]|uniref:hypothetical protein n=1 Tax=Streptomyces sp. NPDC056192 TaxID=3345743 RepID=UPI0035E2E24F
MSDHQPNAECGWNPADATPECDWDRHCPTHGQPLAEAPQYLVAEHALAQIRDLASASEEVRGIVAVAEANISMARRSRPRVSNRRSWLAKVTSFTFPRTFTRTWGKPAEHHVCFSLEITDGSKAAIGRKVEVQLAVDDAERLAEQMLRIAEFQRSQTSEKEGER